MKTAQWATYSGPGRIALSQAPRGTPKGYRLSKALYLGSDATLAEVQASFALADACAIWRAFHLLVYPHEPVLMGEAPLDVDSYRMQVACWIASHTGESIPELDPKTYRPTKQGWPTLHGLHSANQLNQAKILRLHPGSKRSIS
ncbi:hypothetical protein HCU64_07725 [Methylobacterium sp. C25]|uniref:hypothetical protein n=1 Tax=Methylobacterium sp. C25 TaxID=2721622 RepID=UPI001F1FEEAB|nr:hypothetical protein [Methylobacterium sp. C25]MCE4223635.1 hypothetical protein [Methylobacterium sp. C25]